jgi:hypothetical protein
MGTMKAPLLLASMLVAAAATVRAQQPQMDPRWEAWLGCWSAVEGSAPTPTGRVPTVCVVPAGHGVDVLTVVDTSVVTRDHIDALAARHEVSRESCTGWGTDAWSAEGDRLYRQSEYTCPGDVKRTASEVFAITPDWDWLDVQGLSARGEMGVRTIRYRSAAVPAVAEITTALASHVSGAARAMAAMPPRPADVVEAARKANPAVVEAWLAEEGEPFPLNGRQLEALADSGVPPRVIDIMVALTYPNVFTVAAPSARAALTTAAARRPPAPDTMYAYRQPYGLYAAPYPWGWDYYSPWSWSLYGYYSPFYYSPYGQFAPYYYGGYGYGGYGGYYYGGGTIIVQTGGSGSGNPPPPHGRIVKGKGYEYGQGSSQPRSAGNTGRETSSSSGSSSSGGSSSAAPRSSGSSSGSSSQVGQHAKPKP